jgi:hypothetical protein
MQNLGDSGDGTRVSFPVIGIRGQELLNLATIWRRAMRIGKKRLSSRAILIGGVVWFLAIGTGFLALIAYETKPGPAGAGAMHWPAGSRVPLASDRPTLILFSHPRCPCSRATVAELARILAECKGQVAAFVLVYAPARADHEWAPGGSVQRLAGLPNVRLVDDPGGLEAAQFGAQTSGYVVLYGPDGRLLFRGGITGARGHEGDNAGRDAVVALISGGASSGSVKTPVFGCRILDLSATPLRRVTPWAN